MYRRRTASWAMAAALTVATLTGALLPVVTGSAPASPVATARADDVTASLDNLRTGWDPNEPGLSPAVVGGGTFKQLFKTTVNGQVYAQPVVVGSTVIVATENDWVYGLDAATGAVQWKTSLGTPYNITTCSDLTPHIGVTGTPVYDPDTGDVYLFGQTVSSGSPHWYLFGISASTGAIAMKRLISGTPTNDSHFTFHPAYQMPRTGVLLMNGSVYAGFASHCDHNSYVGFVAGVNVSTGARTLWADESGVTEDKGGIWQGGGGVMSDGPGRIFVTSGNGVSPAAGKGTSPPGQLAESVIRLGVNSNGSLAAKDFFSPANAPSLDAADTDFGAGGPVGLPFGTTTYPDVLVQAGKDGRIFLLNRDSLGGRKQGPGGTDNVLSVKGPYGGQWGHPAVFGNTTTLTASTAGGASDYLYYVGKNSVLRVFKFGVNGSDAPTLANVANSSLTYGYSSGSPVVTSNGADATSAVLWVVYTSGPTGASGELDAYDVSSTALSGCTSSSPCTLPRLWHASIGTAAKFVIPATSSGRVYVGTRDGHVYGFGVAGAAALTNTPPVTFTPTSVSSPTSKPVTVTAAKTTTVTGVTASTGASNAAAATTQDSAGQVTETKKGSGKQVPVTFPVRLTKGDQLHAPVTFTPLAPGGSNGTLSFATTSASAPSVDVPLNGEGTQAGLTAQPAALAFPLAPDQGVTDVPIGIAVPQTIQISNFGTTAETVASAPSPSGPFTATGLPAPGTTIKPGQSVAVQVTYAPSLAGPATGSFTITDTDSTSVTVQLSGTGTAAVSQLTAAKTTVNLGSVPVGQSATADVHITNTGNQPSTVTSTSTPGAPFHAVFKVAKDLPFNPSYDLMLPVTFTPTKTGSFTAHYTLTWTDRLGTHTIAVTLTGKGT